MIASSTNFDKVLTALFQRNNGLKKNVFLIVDEVRIRPTVSFAGGMLSGMTINEPTEKATSMLGVFMKCMHGGPSLMISGTPVQKLTAKFQYDTVIEMAIKVEKCGGIVLGSITDNLIEFNEMFS